MESLRYSTILRQSKLWERYPQITDDCDKDHIVDLVTNRVFAWERRHGTATNLPGLVYRIASGVISSFIESTNHYRLKQESIDGHKVDSLAASTETPNRLSTLERQQYIRELIASLDDRERKVVIGTYQGLTANEIAAGIPTSPANVRQILSRIRKRLLPLR